MAEKSTRGSVTGSCISLVFNSVKSKRSTATRSLDFLKDDEAGREMNSNEDDDEKKRWR